MGKHIVETKWWVYWQNNSGGSFDIDDERGIGPRVWVEAVSTDDADSRMKRLGGYFNGVEDGQDCECCGDRWSPAYGTGHDSVEINPDYDFNWHDTVYAHGVDGTIQRFKQEPL